MMFSPEYYKEIKAAFDRQMELADERIRQLGQEAHGEDAGINALTARLLAEKKKEILDSLERCTQEEAQALTFLYSAMPLSDLQDYPASLFLAYARHGVFLWNQGPFAGRVPEKIFANYVLHHRVNNEDIADTRGFFYDRVKEAVDLDKAVSGSMYDTAIDTNYWCAREATYRSTDGRTQNPRTMYNTAAGRCGEESTFAVTTLRSIGIPARQVYAPLWTHCDDNHAWVELWCDGKWYFLGACEPEEEMNRGWFTGPASRGVMLHSRWFGKDAPEEVQVGPRGMAIVLNHTDRYAETMELTVKVVDDRGMPVPNAKIDFRVLNHGCFGSVALVYAGSEGENCGRASLVTGFGDLYVSAGGVDADGRKLYGEGMVNLAKSSEKRQVEADGSEEYPISAKGQRECREYTITLKEKPECRNEWKEIDIHAPKLRDRYDSVLTEEQQKAGEKRLAQAAQYRQNKSESFYDGREAERVLGRFDGEDREKVKEILHMANGNIGEIVRFLEWDADWLQPSGASREGWKLKVLQSLREKDYWDIKAEVLTDCCINAFSYMETVPEDVFYKYLLCPRVFLELLRPCRMALKKYWEEYTDDHIKETLLRDPGCLPEIAGRWITSMPEQEYESLITSSLGCLRGGIGSKLSIEVFCVNLYRALGIPARLNYLNGRVEYYRGGKDGGAGFVPCGACPEEQTGANCRLILREDGFLKLTDWEHYSLEHFDGNGFRRLGLWGEMSNLKDGRLELQVRPGIYRAVTTNRKKDGDQLARMMVFELQDEESRELILSMRETPLADMLTNMKVEDFSVKTMEGDACTLSALTGEEKALFLWLGVTKEPTEHILNELYDRQQIFKSLKTPVYAILRSAQDLENKTLSRTLEALPMIHTLLDDFGENYRRLAEKVGQEPGKLPLAVVLNGQQECIYSDSGYNVGLADMLYKILVS